MAIDKFRKGQSLYSSTTNSFGTGTGETITPSSVTGLPTDTMITLTFDRLVTGKIERIIGHISGANFVIDERGVDGTSDQAHTSPVVEYIDNARDRDDFVDGILVGHAQTGVHTAASTIASGEVELATTAETTTGTAATLAVTPDGLHDMTSLAGATWFLDEDDMATDSATKVPSQQSVKAHVASGTVTMTNKRITPRVVTATDDATAAIDCDVTDQYQLTAVANATEFTVTGTPTNGQKLIIRLKDAGAGKALTWTGFTAVGVTLPTTTVANKTHYIGCIYNSAAVAWDAVAVVAQA